MPHPSTPSLTATSPHPHGSPPSAPLPPSPPPPRYARRRHRRPASASPARASPASGFRIPPCSSVHTTVSATTHASGRSRSLHTSFPNKTARSVPHPSTPSLTATSPHPHGSPPSAPLPLSPHPRRRRGLRPPPASASPPAPVSAPPPAPLPSPPVADAPCTLPSPTRRHGPCLILQPHPSLLHPHTLTARRLRRLCPSHPLRLALLAVGTTVPLPRRRRGLRPPPASAYPPSPVSTPPRAPLPTPPVADAPCTLPSPTRRHGPCPILQPHPSLLHPHTLTARRLRRLCPSHPLRLAPLAVDTAVPLPRRRCALRPPPASASPPAPVSTPLRAPLPTPPVARAPSTLPSPTRRHGPGPILQPHPSLLHPPPSRLAAFGAFAALTPSASLRSPSAPPSHIRVAGAGCARLRLPLPPGSGVRTTAGATTHASGRSRSLRTSFANKAAGSMPNPSTPSLPATSPRPHGSPPSAPLPLSTLPPRSARRRRPPSRFRVAGAGFARHWLPHPPCSDVRTTASATTHASGRWRSLHTPFANKAAWSAPHPSTPSLPATSPHPHGSPPSAPLPLSTPPPRSARRRRRRPTSASTARASPASGFRIPPAPMSAPPPAPLPTPPVAGAPSTLPSPTRRHGPGLILQHHPSPLHPPPSRLAAFGAFAALTPPSRSARRRHRRPASASPVRAAPASGFRIPLLQCPQHRGRHYPRLRSLALPTHSLRQQGAMVRASSFNTIPRRYIPHPHGSPPSAPLPPSPPPPRSARRRRRRPASPSPARASPASGFRIPLLQCPQHRGRHYPRLRSLALPTHFLRQQGRMVRASSFNTIPPCYIPSPSRLAAFGAFAPLNPSASLRSPSTPVSAPLRAPLPSAPSAVTATQSPCRLLSAGFGDVDSPSLVPWDLSFLTAQHGFGLHTTGSRRFGGSAALPPHRLAQSPLHLMRHRSDTGLHITIVAGDAFHVHHAADHQGTARRVPVTTPMVMPPVNLSVMTMMARQLDRSADFTSKGLHPSLPDRATPSSPLRRLASSPAIPRPSGRWRSLRTSLAPTRRHAVSTPLRGLPYATHGVSSPHLRTSSPAHPQGAADRDARHLAQGVRCLGVVGAAFARHRLPLPALLRCPHHCGRHRRRLRQRASHDCPQLLLQWPPLSRRGGSFPPVSPASIPPRLYPGIYRP